MLLYVTNNTLFSGGNMNQAQIRSIYCLAIWGTVALAFCGVFFLRGGPEGFAGDSLRILIAALDFGFGYLVYILMLKLTRKKSSSTAMLQDERDHEIARRANGTALVSVMTFIFILSIILFTLFQDLGVLPAGWLWFLAYFTSCFAYIVHAVVTLFLYREMSGND